GFVNFALCVSVGGKPAAAVDVREFSCGNDKRYNCSNPVQIAPFSSTCSAGAMAATNPFDGGTDTVASCDVVLADFVGVEHAALADVCSFPSMTPNSDPSDCVIFNTLKDPCTGVDCSDTNPCTADSCDGSSGQAVCVHVPGGQAAVCRPAAGPCDVDEMCDGMSTSCPPNGFVVGGTICRASAGVCDVAEACTGTSAQCPPDVKSTALCRAAAGPCDVPESCDGTTHDCPPAGFAGAGVLCRAAAGVCDGLQPCTGSSVHCPPA